MAITKTINLEVNTKDAQKSLKGLEKGVEDVNKEVKDTSKTTEQMGGTLDKVSGGAVSKFGAFKGAITSVTTGFKSLRVAIIATGIGALLIAVVALGQAFTRSEEGQNQFAKILGVIGSVTGNLLDLLADLGESIISVFENPQQAIKDFANLIKENITNRFDGLLNLIPQIGKAIGLLFEGEFTEAGKVAADAVGKVVLGVDSITDSVSNTIEKVKEFGEEVAADAVAAAKIADQRAKATKLETALITERAQAQQDIARLREQAANKEKFTAEKRIEFLKEAGEISTELAEKETTLAKLKLQAKLTENELTKSTIQDKQEAAQLEADVINKTTQNLNLQKRLTTELLTAQREASAQTKKDAKEEPVVVDKKLQKIYDIQKAYIKKQQDLEAETEIQKIQLEKERKLNELKDLNAHFIAKAQVAVFYENKIQDVKDKNAADDLKKEKILQNQKIAIVGQTFGTMAAILGENSKAGKAFGIAQALTNTYLGVTEVLGNDTTLPEPFGTIQKVSSIAGVLATGFAAVKSIKSVKPNGGGGGTPSLPSGGGSAPTPPAFNVVGSSGESQLADAIGGQTQRPSRAYVVSNDVTTAQEMDRNIIEGASI